MVNTLVYTDVWQRTGPQAYHIQPIEADTTHLRPRAIAQRI